MLTATKIQALKPAAKPYKVPDADGLFLLVQPSGVLANYWLLSRRVTCRRSE